MLNEAELEELRKALAECEQLRMAGREIAGADDRETLSLTSLQAAFEGDRLTELGA